jgi:hypothetical protein
MESLALRWRAGIAPAIREGWTRHGAMLMRVVLALLAIYAAFKLGDEFRRLLWEQRGSGAVDLRLRHREVQGWFAGNPIYAEYSASVYPPATMVMLYPLMGWMSLDAARWFWAATTVAVLIWLVYLLAKHSGAETRVEQTFVALLLLAMNATGVVVGNGQLILHQMPFLIVGLFALEKPASWRRDVVVALCMIVSLVKPSVSAPFLWLVLFASGGWRVSALIAFGYGALTLFAASFQSAPLLSLLRAAIANGSAGVATTRYGYGNINNWLVGLGIGEWMLPAIVLTFIAFGIWVYRRAELWLLLGVTAIVARLWSYHTLSDDVLILFPMIALFRIVKQGQSDQGDDVAAGLLLAATMLLMLLPARSQFFPFPWNLPFVLGHPLIWIIVMVFLMRRAQRDEHLARLRLARG